MLCLYWSFDFKWQTQMKLYLWLGVSKWYKMQTDILWKETAQAWGVEE